jgi:hypothetical protein
MQAELQQCKLGQWRAVFNDQPYNHLTLRELLDIPTDLSNGHAIDATNFDSMASCFFA